MFEKILVCLDGSKAAEQILPYAIEPCFRFGSSIVFFRVVTTEITVPPAQSIHLPLRRASTGKKRSPISDIGGTESLEPKVEAQLDEVEREQAEAREYLDGIARPYVERALKVSTVVGDGEPGEAIMEYSKENGVTLIALTTHGQGGMKGKLMGRVAQFVLKESGTPVLIVKPPADS
jgi:nucleotide-binding universal stress UspA family protein